MSGEPANARVAGAVAGVAATMLVAAYAAVPLYAAFCKATGFGGTPQVAANAPALRGERRLEVRFDANVAPGLEWSFAPETDRETVRTGETKTVFFRVHNRTNRTLSAVAAFNVAPPVAGAWFDKISCFCFSEQTLGPGESAEWPVVFFLDPRLERDNSMAAVEALTLSYTLFPAKVSERPVALAPAGEEPKL